MLHKVDEQKSALKPLCPSSSSSSASSSHSTAVSWGRTRQGAWLRPRAEEAGAEIWGQSLDGGGKRPHRGAEHGYTEKNPSNSNRCNCSQASPCGRRESQIWRSSKLRMNPVMLDWNEDAGISSTFRTYRHIGKIQMQMCLYM